MKSKRGRRELSLRERQVLALMAKGYENDAIARELGLSGYTLKCHTHRIYRKLNIADTPGVNQRVLAVLWYIER